MLVRYPRPCWTWPQKNSKVRGQAKRLSLYADHHELVIGLKFDTWPRIWLGKPVFDSKSRIYGCPEIRHLQIDEEKLVNLICWLWFVVVIWILVIVDKIWDWLTSVPATPGPWCTLSLFHWWLEWWTLRRVVEGWTETATPPGSLHLQLRWPAHKK